MRTKLIITLFLCVACLSLSSQAILKKSLNQPRSGDEIIKQQVEYKDPGHVGENALWDFSKLKTVNNSYSIVYSSPDAIGDSIYVIGLDTLSVSEIKSEELLIGTEHSTMYYYRLADNGLLLMGHENPTSIFKYEEPLSLLQYPFSFKDSIKVGYSAGGVYSSTESFSTSGNSECKYDAFGMMIIPSGDTLRNVIRLKTTKTVIFTLDNNKDVNAPAHSVIENYKWYARGYRYPVFETIRNEGSFETAFFYPPGEQSYMDDEENMALREENKDVPAGPWDGLKYNYYPNPVGTTLNVEIYLPKQSGVKIQINNQAGNVLISDNKGVISEGLYKSQIDVSMLYTGYYVLAILLDDYMISQIIIKK